jgi:hypothetical protein
MGDCLALASACIGGKAVSESSFRAVLASPVDPKTPVTHAVVLEGRLLVTRADQDFAVRAARVLGKRQVINLAHADRRQRPVARVGDLNGHVRPVRGPFSIRQAGDHAALGRCDRTTRR